MSDKVPSNGQVLICCGGTGTKPVEGNSATLDDADPAAVWNYRLSLLQLPTELLINIFEALLPGSLASAARVCRSLAHAATTVLLRSPSEHELRPACANPSNFVPRVRVERVY